MAQDNPFADLIQPQPSARTGRIIMAPRTAKQQAEEARANNAEARAAGAEARAKEAADRAQREWNASHNPDGSSKKPLENIPASSAAGIQENLKTLRSINAAINALDARPSSIGTGTGFFGDTFTQWNDPQGTATRSAVGKVGAYTIHDLSGAAVSASEAPRFTPFVPSITDRPEVARMKLEGFRKELSDTLQSQLGYFSENNGYKPYRGPDIEAFLAPPKRSDSAPVTIPADGPRRDNGGMAVPGANPPGSGGPQGGGGFTNKGEWKVDPSLAGVNAQVSGMIQAGRSASEIRQYLNGVQPGLGDKANNLDANIAWSRRHPNYAVPVDLEKTWKPSGPIAKAVGGALMSAPGAAVVGAVNGATMGGLDELASGISQLTGDGRSADYYDAMKVGIRQASPMSYGLGELGGTVGAGALAATGAPGIARAATATLPRVMATGAGVGAINGALESNQNRLGGAAFGGVVGAAGGPLGLALGRAGEVLMRSRLGQRAEQALRNRGAITIPEAQQFTQPESAILGMRPDLQQVTTNLRDAGNLNLPYALADAAPELRALSGTVSRIAPNAGALAEQTFAPRSLGQADRAVQAIDQYLAPITDVAARGKELLTAGNDAARPYYNMAASKPNPIQPGMDTFFANPSGTDPQIAALLRTPSGQDALRRAQQIANDRGSGTTALGLVDDGRGNMVLNNGHTFDTLDMVKKGFDARLQEAANPITGKIDFAGNPQLQAVESLRQRLVSRMDELNPQYPLARAEYGKYAKRKEALDVGYGQLPKGSVPETQFNQRLGDLQAYDANVSNPLDALIPEAQRGYATALADQVDRARLSSNPYQAIYGSPLQQRKVSGLFPKGAKSFDRTYVLEGDMAKTATELLGGSQTARRQAADGAIGGNLLGHAANAAIDTTLTGAPVRGLLDLARNYAKDRARLGFGEKARQRAEDMAGTLFDTSNPAGMASMVDEMLAKQAQAQLRKQAYGRAGSILGAGSGILWLPTAAGN